MYWIHTDAMTQQQEEQERDLHVLKLSPAENIRAKRLMDSQ
jgi:hypothetical protein